MSSESETKAGESTLGSEKALSDKWKREYEKGGIPSSTRAQPSSVVSRFFYGFFSERRGFDVSRRVADLGCGKGRNAFFFADKGCEVWAVDIVEENVERINQYAREHGLKVTAVCADITAPLDLEDNSVDIIIDIFCYKHQTDASKREAYRKELMRVLKDEGVYLISLAGKDDGYYGALVDADGAEVCPRIVDPHTGVGSVLFAPEDVETEFEGFFCARKQTVTKLGMMHGKEYMRETHALILQKDSPENRAAVVLADGGGTADTTLKR